MHSFFYHQFLLLFLSLGLLATLAIDPQPGEDSSSQNFPIENGARNLMSASIGRTMNEPITESEGCLPPSMGNRVGRSKKLARRGAVCKNNIQSGGNQPLKLPENELPLPIFDPFSTFAQDDNICPEYPGISYTRPACAEERFATMSPPFSGFYKLSRCQPYSYFVDCLEPVEKLWCCTDIIPTYLATETEKETGIIFQGEGCVQAQSHPE